MQPVVGKALAIAGKLLWAVTGNVLQIGGSAGSDRKRHRGPWHRQEVPVALRCRADPAPALHIGGERGLHAGGVRVDNLRIGAGVLQPGPPGALLTGTVTVEFRLLEDGQDPVAAVYLDEVRLAPTPGGPFRAYLPLLSR